MAKPLNLIGERFGRLTVLNRVENDKHGNTRWLCKCDCGKETTVVGALLRKGHTTSCGCYSREVSVKNLPDKTTHHLSRTPLYQSWILMKQRCFNNKRKDWGDYGGRGIGICDEWLDSNTFFEWALQNGYSEGKTLDRINVDGNYEPTNCRWSTHKEQGRNKRNNVHVEINGYDYVLSELAEKYNLPYHTLWYRYNHGDRGERLIRPIDVKRQPKRMR